MRFYKVVGSDGTLPADQPVQIGTVIRVASNRSRKPGAQWNAEACEWVKPIWREVPDPRTVAAEVSA